jgi:hypothetical protein
MRLLLHLIKPTSDPLTQGVSIAELIVPGVISLLLTAVAALAIEHRDLRA